MEIQAGRGATIRVGAKDGRNHQGRGRETKSTRSHTINLSWTVKNVASNGEAEITHRIERVRVRIEAPPYMPFDFDSDAPKVDAPGPFEAVAQLTKAMAGVEFTFKMKPSGEIVDIVITAQTMKSLRDAVKPPEGAGPGLERATCPNKRSRTC